MTVVVSEWGPVGVGGEARWFWTATGMAPNGRALTLVSPPRRFSLATIHPDDGQALMVEAWQDALAQAELGDAHDEPDTGKPPCTFCRREVPCECGPTWATGRPEDCMCTCGRCMAP